MLRLQSTCAGFLSMVSASSPISPGPIPRPGGTRMFLKASASGFPRVPRWRVKCVLDYSPSDRWFATLAMHYSSRQYGTLDNSDTHSGYGAVDQFLIFDTKVSYRIKDYLTATLGVDNLTDQLYHVSHPYPRRTIFAGLKYTY